MLQIATGKLFSREAGRTNNLRGVMYTNAVFPYGTMHVDVSTGRLLPPSSTVPGVKSVAYEFIERIELEPDGTQGVLVSSTSAPYVLDFATVCSFALDCIWSPDFDVVRRLIGTQPGVSTGTLPGRFVKRMYEPDFHVQPGQIEFLQSFVEQLIGLQRVKFLGAMRAIRTYVSAMHRVADDLELAYTLLVASVESLAQDFDGHQADWASLEDRKRTAMDEALEGAGPDIAERVRHALLSVEHIALARRFREFTLAHVADSFFRAEAAGLANAAARADLPDCLREAYTLRSKYVHSLKRLPHMLTTGHVSGEVVVESGVQYFTIAGLSRLMRHVIINFVVQQPTVPHEVYDYRLERYGFGQYPLDPAYWVGGAVGDITHLGKDKLGGFLQQLTQSLLRMPGATITDLRPVLERVNEFAPRITRDLRRPYLALMALFNWFAPNANRVEPAPQVADLIAGELGVPSTEALCCYCLTETMPDWTHAEHSETLLAYFRRRGRKNGYRLPRLLEAAVTLALAERYRLAGNLTEFRRWVSFAVENHPGNPTLLALESSLRDDQPLRWSDVLLPHGEPAGQPAGAAEAHDAEGRSGLKPTGMRAVLAVALRKLLEKLEAGRHY